MSHKTMTHDRRTVRTLLCLAGLVVVAIGLRLCVGYHFGWPGGNVLAALGRLWPADWWWGQTGSIETLQILDIRVRRVVMAVVVGAALSASGVGLQALLRNPLAEPFILGLSSGAAVGIMLQLWLGQWWQVNTGPQSLGALAGALVNMAIVYAAGRRRGVIDPIGLLLVGVVLATINGSMIILLNYLSDSGEPERNITRWMMGQLDEGVDASTLVVVASVVAAGLIVLWNVGPAMDVGTFSDTEAESIGMPIGRLRSWLFLVCGCLAAGAVVLAGPIAFVGLICPHVARLLLGPSHRTLLTGSVLIGAILLLLADSSSVATDWGRGQVPLGIFTAMIGGPVFIAMLRPYLGRGQE